MVYQPVYKGQTFPGWAIPLDTDTGHDDLTGIDVTKLSLVFRSDGGVDRTGTGTFAIRTVYPAMVLYKPSVTDVASVFSGTLIVEGLFPPSGTTADKTVYSPVTFAITDD